MHCCIFIYSEPIHYNYTVIKSIVARSYKIYNKSWHIKNMTNFPLFTCEWYSKCQVIIIDKWILQNFKTRNFKVLHLHLHSYETFQKVLFFHLSKEQQYVVRQRGDIWNKNFTFILIIKYKRSIANGSVVPKPRCILDSTFMLELKNFWINNKQFHSTISWYN